MTGVERLSFVVAVNLLELSELQEAMKQIQSNDELSLLPFKVTMLVCGGGVSEDC